MNEAASYALKFIEKYIMKLDNDDKKGFRSRARDLYHKAYFEGLKSVMVFAYSKAGESKIQRLLNNIDRDSYSDDDKSDYDYAYYAVAILSYLKEQLSIEDIDGTINNLLCKLNDKSIENRILQYMRWIKYFTEAKIEVK